MTNPGELRPTLVYARNLDAEIDKMRVELEGERTDLRTAVATIGSLKDECDQLRAQNAELLAALEWLVAVNPDPELDIDRIRAEYTIQAATAIARAKL